MVFTDSHLEMTRSEIVASVEREAKRAGYSSARKLARAYRERKIADPASVVRALVLLDLLSESDPLFAEAIAKP